MVARMAGTPVHQASDGRVLSSQATLPSTAHPLQPPATSSAHPPTKSFYPLLLNVAPEEAGRGMRQPKSHCGNRRPPPSTSAPGLGQALLHELPAERSIAIPESDSIASNLRPARPVRASAQQARLRSPPCVWERSERNIKLPAGAH